MKFFAIIILLGVISGYYPKLTSILHWYITWSFIHMSSAIDGGDQIAAILTIYLIPLTFLDKRKNHWQIGANLNYSPRYLVSTLLHFLIRLQAFGIYFHAGVGKLNHTEWANGTAVYYWFNHAVFGKPEYLNWFIDPIINNNYGVTLLTFGTIVFEIFLALCLFMPLKYRKFVFPFAILFHFSIIFIHGIFSFFFSMAALLIFYLLDLRKIYFK